MTLHNPKMGLCLSYKLVLNIKKKKLQLLLINEVFMRKKRDWSPAKIKYELAKKRFNSL